MKKKFIFTLLVLAFLVLNLNNTLYASAKIAKNTTAVTNNDNSETKKRPIEKGNKKQNIKINKKPKSYPKKKSIKKPLNNDLKKQKNKKTKVKTDLGQQKTRVKKLKNSNKKKVSSNKIKNTSLEQQSTEPPEKMSLLLMDASSGKILLQSNCSELKYPASLTKLMTLYLAFNAVKKGLVEWHDPLTTSDYAASQEPSKLGLQQGEQISLKDAVMSLIVKSANDVAVTIAENLGKIYAESMLPEYEVWSEEIKFSHRTKQKHTPIISPLLAEKIFKIKSKNSVYQFVNTGSYSKYEKLFVQLMNHKAKTLGMVNSQFINPSGLHHEEQMTTAVDMAIMAAAIKRDFPNYYSLFSQISHSYKGKNFCTTNEVTKTYPGAEGLKTGFTKASGFNLVTTVKRNNIELIGVVLGVESSQSRNLIMTQMLDLGMKKLSQSQGRHYHPLHSNRRTTLIEANSQL